MDDTFLNMVKFFVLIELVAFGAIFGLIALCFFGDAEDGGPQWPAWPWSILAIMNAIAAIATFMGWRI